ERGFHVLDKHRPVPGPRVSLDLALPRALLVGSEDDWPGTLAALDANGTYIAPAESAVLEISTYL
ncbi:hypothetical protein, partial [Actinocrinis sp.]|uniref:hypothetical protein n=1 Tax=Actinocrinis sp. TaxID=1920516 RepID=UPI002D660E68